MADDEPILPTIRSICQVQPKPNFFFDFFKTNVIIIILN